MRTRDSYVRERRAQAVSRGRAFAEPVAQSLLEVVDEFIASLRNSAIFHLFLSLLAGYMSLLNASDFVATLLIMSAAASSTYALHLGDVNGVLDR